MLLPHRFVRAWLVLSLCLLFPLAEYANAQDVVSETDTEVEQLIRAAIEERFPGDAFFGEEFGHNQADAADLWIVEHIDGTQPFLKELSPGFDRSWVREMHVFHSDYAAPITPTGYGRRVPDLAAPIPGLYMATMAQIYPEDRGVDCGVVLGRKVAARMLAESEGTQEEVEACTSSSVPA